MLLDNDSTMVISLFNLLLTLSLSWLSWVFFVIQRGQLVISCNYKNTCCDLLLFILLSYSVLSCQSWADMSSFWVVSSSVYSSHVLLAFLCRCYIVVLWLSLSKLPNDYKPTLLDIWASIFLETVFACVVVQTLLEVVLVLFLRWFI